MSISKINQATATHQLIRVFDCMPGCNLLMMPDAPHYTVVTATADWLVKFRLQKEQVVGKGFFEVLGENMNNLDAVRHELEESLQTVAFTKERHRMSQQRYDTLTRSGRIIERYWDSVNSAVLDPLGEVEFIISSIEEITEKVITERQHASRENFEYFFNQAVNPFSILQGESLMFTFANPAYQALMNNRTLVGKTLKEAIPEIEGQEFEQLLHDVLKMGIPWHGAEIPATANFNGDKEPSTRYFNLSYTPYRNQAGEIEGILASGYDITEAVELRKQQKSIELSQQARDLFMQAPFGIYFFSGPNHVLTLANHATLNFGGMNARVIGKTLSEVLPPDQAQYYTELMNDVMRTREAFTLTEASFNIDTDAGVKNIFLNVVYQPVIENDVATGIMATVYDVTDQVLARHKVEESERRFRNLLEQAPDPIMILKGADMVVELANTALLKQWDADESVYGKPFTEVLPEMKDQQHMQQLRQVFSTGETYYGREEQTYFLRPDGARHVSYMNYVFHPYRELDGQISGVIVMATDVTAHVHARNEQQKTERNFRNLIMRAPVGIAIVRGNNYELEIVNSRMLEMWGKNMEDVINKPIFEGLPEVADKGFREILDGVYQTRKRYVAEDVPVVFNRFGTPNLLYCNFVYEPLWENDGSISGIIAVMTDNTEQVLSRKKIEESEAAFRLLADSMPQLVWTADAASNFNYFNKAFYKTLGIDSCEDVMNVTCAIHPDDHDEFVRQWEHSIASGEDFIFQHRLKNLNNEYRWQLSRAIAQRNSDGEIQMWVGTSTDVHDNKVFQDQLQKRVKERTAELEKKNSELEQYAYVSSHDLQEPLRKIQMFASLIKKQDFQNLGATSQKRFDQIISTVERMSASLRDLLNFASLNNGDHFIPVDLNTIFNGVRTDLELVISHKRAIVEVSDLPVLQAIPLQMNQLFYNLLNNALKFARAGVNPIVKVTATPALDEEVGAMPVLDRSKRYWKITFEDNGIGFDLMYAEQIFSMFQRLHDKKTYEGTGIGLTLCKKVALNHGGDIYASSRINEGAAFHIILPETQD